MSTSMWIWRVILPGLGLIACAVVLRESSRPEGSTSTNVSATASSDRSPGRVAAEGRIVARPGSQVTLGSEVGGVVAARVSEKTRVKKGDILVEFRSDDLMLALAETEAKLAEADADLSYQLGDYSRKVKASTNANQFVNELYASRHDLEVAQARRKAADVAVSRARLLVARAKIASPIDGVVLETFVEPGEVAIPGSRLATVCDLSRLRIEAEVDEFDVARISEGDDVVIKAEGYAESYWNGKVEEIPDRVAARSLRPDDPGRPTDTRVLLVKIGLTSPITLKLGQQVEIEIHPRR